MLDELIREYIGIIFVLIFLVFPRLFKWLITRGGRTPSQVETTIGEMISGEKENSEVVPQSVIDARREVLSNLKKATAQGLSKAHDLYRQCELKGGAAAEIKQWVELGAVKPFSSLLKEIKRAEANGNFFDERLVIEKHAKFDALNAVLAIIEQMVEQRIQPAYSLVLGALDKASLDCMAPYRAYADKQKIPYLTKSVLCIIDHAGRDVAGIMSASPLAAAVIDSNSSELPRGWVNLVSDVSMDVFYSTKGLSNKISAAVGTGGHGSQAAALIFGLVNSWLPRIFGDVGASIYLGPGTASGLSATLGRGSEEDLALIAELKDVDVEVPMYIRVLVMCRTLRYLGFAEDAEIAQKAINRRLGEPTALVVKDQFGNTASIPLAPILQVTERAVDIIAGSPTMGNQLLSRIPKLRCTEADRVKMGVVAQSLIEGTPVNASSRILIGAALIAVNKASVHEVRIGRTALRSMLTRPAAVSPQSLSGLPSKAGASTIYEGMRSPEDILRAVAMGAALSPRRTGRIGGYK